MFLFYGFRLGYGEILKLLFEYCRDGVNGFLNLEGIL